MPLLMFKNAVATALSVGLCVIPETAQFLEARGLLPALAIVLVTDRPGDSIRSLWPTSWAVAAACTLAAGVRSLDYVGGGCWTPTVDIVTVLGALILSYLAVFSRVSSIFDRFGTAISVVVLIARSPMLHDECDRAATDPAVLVAFANETWQYTLGVFISSMLGVACAFVTTLLCTPVWSANEAHARLRIAAAHITLATRLAVRAFGRARVVREGDHHDGSNAGSNHDRKRHHDAGDGKVPHSGHLARDDSDSAPPVAVAGPRVAVVISGEATASSQTGTARHATFRDGQLHSASVGVSGPGVLHHPPSQRIAPAGSESSSITTSESVRPGGLSIRVPSVPDQLANVASSSSTTLQVRRGEQATDGHRDATATVDSSDRRRHEGDATRGHTGDEGLDEGGDDEGDRATARAAHAVQDRDLTTADSSRGRGRTRTTSNLETPGSDTPAVRVVLPSRRRLVDQPLQSPSSAGPSSDDSSESGSDDERPGARGMVAALVEHPVPLPAAAPSLTSPSMPSQSSPGLLTATAAGGSSPKRTLASPSRSFPVIVPSDEAEVGLAMESGEEERGTREPASSDNDALLPPATAASSLASHFLPAIRTNPQTPMTPEVAVPVHQLLLPTPPFRPQSDPVLSSSLARHPLVSALPITDNGLVVAPTSPAVLAMATRASVLGSRVADDEHQPLPKQGGSESDDEFGSEDDHHAVHGSALSAGALPKRKLGSRRHSRHRSTMSHADSLASDPAIGASTTSGTSRRAPVLHAELEDALLSSETAIDKAEAALTAAAAESAIMLCFRKFLPGWCCRSTAPIMHVVAPDAVTAPTWCCVPGCARPPSPSTPRAPSAPPFVREAGSSPASPVHARAVLNPRPTVPGLVLAAADAPPATALLIDPNSRAKRFLALVRKLARVARMVAGAERSVPVGELHARIADLTRHAMAEFSDALRSAIHTAAESASPDRLPPPIVSCTPTCLSRCWRPALNDHQLVLAATRLRNATAGLLRSFTDARKRVIYRLEDASHQHHRHHRRQHNAPASSLASATGVYENSHSSTDPSMLPSHEMPDEHVRFRAGASRADDSGVDGAVTAALSAPARALAKSSSLAADMGHISVTVAEQHNLPAAPAAATEESHHDRHQHHREQHYDRDGDLDSMESTFHATDLLPIMAFMFALNRLAANTLDACDDLLQRPESAAPVPSVASALALPQKFLSGWEAFWGSTWDMLTFGHSCRRSAAHSPTGSEAASSHHHEWSCALCCGCRCIRKASVWPRTRRAIKAAVAIGIACLLPFAPPLGAPESATRIVFSLNAALTICFVFMRSNGSSFHQAVLRLNGTVVGSVFAFITVIAAGDNRATLIIMLSVWASITSILRRNPKQAYAGAVAGFTAAMVAVGRRATTAHVATEVLGPVVETCIGIALFMLISSLVWPERSSVAAIESFSEALSNGGRVLRVTVRAFIDSVGTPATSPSPDHHHHHHHHRHGSTKLEDNRSIVSTGFSPGISPPASLGGESSLSSAAALVANMSSPRSFSTERLPSDPPDVNQAMELLQSGVEATAASLPGDVQEAFSEPTLSPRMARALQRLTVAHNVLWQLVRSTRIINQARLELSWRAPRSQGRRFLEKVGPSVEKLVGRLSFVLNEVADVLHMITRSQRESEGVWGLLHTYIFLPVTRSLSSKAAMEEQRRSLAKVISRHLARLEHGSAEVTSALLELDFSLSNASARLLLDGRTGMHSGVRGSKSFTQLADAAAGTGVGVSTVPSATDEGLPLTTAEVVSFQASVFAIREAADSAIEAAHLARSIDAQLTPASRGAW